ncbi:GTP-binding protein SAR1 [Nematocida minor]|uniref:GTP-binding protein SAR1 n=1 Tax=Nematocida minor TaxID=1912983 RepID=UPI0022204107|nr:GTP-binding protein SAR1 [Nematocida minor]KAI5189233.1 GTP-binding protein SAR1 [Nematocida minor]
MEYYEKGKQIVLDLIERGPKAIFERLFGKETNILFLGIDNAGKTTLLLRLKTDTIHTVAPTRSVREETLQIGNMKVTINDLGGHETARLGWSTYFFQSHGIIFMIDITDMDRYHIVAETYAHLLYAMEKSGRKTLPIAVLFNKTDMWQKVWEMRNPSQPIPVLDEAYLNYLCSHLGIVTGDGEDGRRISANYCSVVTDSISTQNKGFMLAFKWLDVMIRAGK